MKKILFTGLLCPLLLNAGYVDLNSLDLDTPRPIVARPVVHATEEFWVNEKNMPLIEKAWSINTVGNGVSHTAPPSYYSITINGKKLPGARPWEMRWNMIKDALDYSDKRIVDLGCCMGLAGTFLKKYRKAKKVVGVDAPDYILKSHDSPDRVNAAKLVAQAFGVDQTFIQVDFNLDAYESIVGTDYDVAICMSILTWVKDKERFMRYLTHFSQVIFEGHESDTIEIERFARHGFTEHIILGHAGDKQRTVIYFSKPKQQHSQGIQTCLLENVDLNQCTLAKASVLKDGSLRKIYFDAQKNCYYKIWPENYSRINDFVDAATAGFYEGIAGLQSLIYDAQGICRGYAIKAGQPITSRSDINFISIPGMLKGSPYTFTFFAEQKLQTNLAFREFYLKLLDATRRTGYFHFDFHPHNVVFADGAFQLVDLEAVAPLAQLRDEFFQTSYNPADYRAAIGALKKGM